jgi:hypothetical protein
MYAQAEAKQNQEEESLNMTKPVIGSIKNTPAELTYLKKSQRGKSALS